MRKSNAPALIAQTLDGMCVYLLRNMMGGRFAGSIASCRSRALISGSHRSKMRQVGTLSPACDRNSCADANERTVHPSLLISKASDSRRQMSSSTIETHGVEGCSGSIGPYGDRSMRFMPFSPGIALNRASLDVYLSGLEASSSHEIRMTRPRRGRREWLRQ